MKRFLLLLLVAVCCIHINAQNTTNSPISKYGIGELSMGEGGIYAGMGGVAIGFRDVNYLNTTNPASLSGLGGNKFLVNVGVFGGFKQFIQNHATNTSFQGNVSNMGLGFKVMSKWYSAVSLTPFSSVGYNITENNQIVGTTTLTSSLFEGEGGISKISFSNAYVVNKHLTVGANLSFITGRITQTETQGTSAESIVSRKKALYADFGAQYLHPMKDNATLTIGAIYGYNQRIAQRTIRTVASSVSGESIEERLQSVRQYLPQYIGVGATYNSPKWIFAADYKFTDWSKMQIKNNSITYNDQHRVSLGASRLIGDMYRLPKHIQFGAGCYNSYVVISDKKPINVYVSGGLDLTTIQGTVLSFGVKYTDQFNVNPSNQKERSFLIFLNVAFSERSYRFKLR